MINKLFAEFYSANILNNWDNYVYYIQVYYCVY